MDTRNKRKLDRRAARWAAGGSRFRVMLLACLATLAAGPAGAATNDVLIPAVPLQSGTPYPAPNIMFILDDSGSMVFQTMPRDKYDRDMNDTIYDRSYVHNTLYYNPNTDYETWRKADGTRMTGGDSYTAVYPSLNHAAGDTIDLSKGNSCEYVDENGSNIRVCGGTQLFFVPKAGATDLDDPNQFDRYEIRTDLSVVRLETSVTELLKKTGLTNTGNSRRIHEYEVTVPSGTQTLVAEVMDGTGNPDIEVYERNWRGQWVEICSNNTRCQINDPSGTYQVTVYRRSDYRNVTLLVQGIQQKTTAATPTGRDAAAERKNYAIWYSYHRTRMKTAKAAASEAFSQLGDNYRIGFDTIWNRDRGVKTNGPDLSGGPVHPIPTNVNGGLFEKGSQNRQVWFDFLHAAQGYNGTPLHSALRRAGNYFESDAPWKSEGDSVVSCRLNFSILTTDGYWNNKSTSDNLGNVDNEYGSWIYTPADAAGNRDRYRYEPKLPYKDSHSSTLADIAMHYWKRDLRTDLENDVPTSAEDPAFWQHMVTFGISIGLQGSIDPDTPLKDFEDGTVKWPDPTDKEDSDRIDDLLHAAVNSRGTFVAATNPEKFVRGLLEALTTIAKRPGSASNVTANSTSFNTDTRVYQAKYTSGSWIGELASYRATSAGVETTPAWIASTGIPAYGKRKVLTWNGTGGASFPTSAQVSALDVSERPFSGVSGAANAAYIAGDQSKELAKKDGVLRNRSTVLGDIVNSSPIYVTDSGTIFVGANDGMLHAFDAASGAELFAYVPGGISLSDLATLSDPYYTHKYFVDGPITVSAKSQTPGKNYLVGSLGRGGRGVFGLDVTDPKNFDASKVLWEFRNDNDMGMVLGEPLIVTLNDAAKTKAVVVGNGINSPDGSATLFILNLATGAEIAEIEAGAAGANGLFAPRGWDDNGDGRVDYIYAGDLKGNLWKFDLSGSSSGDWKVANSGKPMFQARDDANTPQPITAGLALARNPDTRDVWVFAGTGRFISEGDLTTVEVQSLYGIIDDGEVKGRTSPTQNGDLARRDIIYVSTDKKVRAFTPNKSPLEDGKKGWFVDFDDPTKGERIVSGLRVLGTVLIASSIIPPQGQSTCDAGGTGYINALDAFTGTSAKEPFFDTNGDGKVDTKDLVTVIVDGKEVQVAAGSYDPGVGMPTRPTIIDKLLVVGGSTGQIASVTINPQGVGARRVSWREIVED